ncbi:MAG: Crp/Fnr family transcriptional regulator [Candidatus Limnocylindria bacterium]
MPPRGTEYLIADLLEEVPIFAALPEADRVEIASRMRRRRFARDEVVFHREDPAAHFYVIAAGTVKIAIEDENGHEVVVAIERGGDVFGELALFDDAPRSATVTAVTETELLALSRDDFLGVLTENPAAMREMLGLLASTVRRASGRIEDLVFLDVPGRVAKCLLDLMQARGDKEEIDLTQDDLAAFVGATRVSVNRALAELEQRGVIAIGRRHIEIKQPDLLRRQVRY